MKNWSLRTFILLLLSIFTGGSQAFSPLFHIAEEKRPFYLEETSTDSDDVEDSVEASLEATLCRTNLFVGNFGFHAVFDDVNHQIDWLFIHVHAARAPPLA